jgi:hypothetical protein
MKDDNVGDVFAGSDPSEELSQRGDTARGRADADDEQVVGPAAGIMLLG